MTHERFCLTPPSGPLRVLSGRAQTINALLRFTAFKTLSDISIYKTSKPFGVSSVGALRFAQFRKHISRAPSGQFLRALHCVQQEKQKTKCLNPRRLSAFGHLSTTSPPSGHTVERLTAFGKISNTPKTLKAKTFWVPSAPRGHKPRGRIAPDAQRARHCCCRLLPTSASRCVPQQKLYFECFVVPLTKCVTTKKK